MWEEKDILIFIKTYPEYSSRYTETVCTGGIIADSRKLIRLYPIAFRYLDGSKQFKKYQWIKAQIRKNRQDDRPESYNIKYESIQLGNKISTSNKWRERKKWVLEGSNIYDSLESLINAKDEEETSLGLIKPLKITGFTIKNKTNDEIDEAQKKKSSIMGQLDMLIDKKDLEILPVKFMLSFSCNHPNCTGHEISILDWEIPELYRKVRNQVNWKQQVENKVISEIFSDKNDTYLIMGNMAKRRNIFCILGFFWPPEDRQQSLFD